MTHLTTFELAITIVSAGFLFAGVANFICNITLKNYNK